MATQETEQKGEPGAMIHVCGLWLGKTRKGENMMSGSMGNIRILIFKVREKRSEKSPDYNLCVVQNEPKEKKTDGEGDGGIL